MRNFLTVGGHFSCMKNRQNTLFSKENSEWHRPLGSPIPPCVAPPFIIHLLAFGEVFGSDTWLVNRLENILLRAKDSSSDIITADIDMYVPLTFSPETCIVCVSFDFDVPSISIPPGTQNC